MMKKLKVMTILGTRPEIIRLSRVIPLFDKFCDHILVHTGQNFDFELRDVFFNDLELREPDYQLNCAQHSKSTAETIGKIISSVDDVIAEVSPEAVLILGDTNSCLAAISAKRRKIPIFHMEAGNRCFDSRVPEEINRRIVDHTADINLAYSDIARDYLLREGLHPECVIKTGSPMREVLNHYKNKIEHSDVLERMSLKHQKYFVVSAHREENVDSNIKLAHFADILKSLSSSFELPIIVSAHPRTRQRLSDMQICFDSNISLVKPLSFTDYIRVQLSAKAVLSDSGTITEESSILNFPAVNLREAHERPEGMEEGSVMMVGLNKERLFQALEILNQQSSGEQRLLALVDDYAPENVSEKVLRIVVSYTDFVRQNTWKEYKS